MSLPPAACRRTPLHSGASSGCAEVVRLLVQGGAHLEARAADGRCAARAAGRWALRLGPARVERCMRWRRMQAGSEAGPRISKAPHPSRRPCRTPLAVACQAGEERAVRMLLALGADAATMDSRRHTAAMQAALAPEPALAAGVPAVLEALAQAGAPLNAVDAAGRTALHLLAGRPGSAAAIRALLHGGANPYIVDAEEQTALGTALAAGNQPAVELLLLAGERVPSAGRAAGLHPAGRGAEGCLQRSGGALSNPCVLLTLPAPQAAAGAPRAARWRPAPPPRRCTTAGAGRCSAPAAPLPVRACPRRRRGRATRTPGACRQPRRAR